MMNFFLSLFTSLYQGLLSQLLLIHSLSNWGFANLFARFSESNQRQWRQFLTGFVFAFAVCAHSGFATAGDANKISVLLHFDQSGVSMLRVYRAANGVPETQRQRQTQTRSMHHQARVVRQLSESVEAMPSQRIADASGNPPNAAATVPMAYWFAADGTLLSREIINDPRLLRVPQHGADTGLINKETGVFLLRGPVLASTLQIVLPDLRSGQVLLLSSQSWFDVGSEEHSPSD